MFNETFRGKAVWSISLDCQCQQCGNDIDLLDTDDFIDNGISPIEHDTYRTKNYEVTCPECAHEFLVDFVY